MAKLKSLEPKPNVIEFPVPQGVIAYKLRDNFRGFRKGDTLYFRSDFKEEEVPESALVALKSGEDWCLGSAGQAEEIVAVYYGRKAA